MKEVKSMVELILVEDIKARNKDAYLYKEVVKKFGYSTQQSFDHIIMLIEQKYIPSFESVRRTRQKIQETNPNLRGDVYKCRKIVGEIVTENINKPTFLEQQELF